MQIAVEARALSHPQPGGFKRYTTSLVRALLVLDRENAYRLYLDRPLADDQRGALAGAACQVVRSVPGWAGVPVREQVVLPTLLARQRPDLLHLPCATGPVLSTAPLVVTIHDAIELLEHGPVGAATPAALRRWLMGRYSRLVQQQLARRADAVITVSQHARGDLMRLLGVPPEKIHIIPNAPADGFRPVDDAAALARLRARYRLPAAFVLTIASASPRKNLAGLLGAYRRLPAPLRERHPLVVVWTHRLLQADTLREVGRLGLRGSVQFLEGVSDDDLALLYNAATLFAFPSLYEGFGLPVLEAMACGTPVVASSRTSVPEVAGDAAILVDPRDADALGRALAEVLADPGLRARLSRASLERAAQFSWERTARMTLDVYRAVEEAARARRRRPRSLAERPAQAAPDLT